MQLLLDGVVDYLPNPLEVRNYALDTTKDEEKVSACPMYENKYNVRQNCLQRADCYLYLARALLDIVFRVVVLSCRYWWTVARTRQPSR